MGTDITIEKLDAAMEWLGQEAARVGVPVETVVRQLIYRGVEAERQKVDRERHHDLDALAGTWSEEDEAEFVQAVEAFNQMDNW